MLMAMNKKKTVPESDFKLTNNLPCSNRLNQIVVLTGTIKCVTQLQHPRKRFHNYKTRSSSSLFPCIIGLHINTY